MVIYGVALLSFCMLVGVFVGDLLGELIGVQANVGGVGIAMLLLIVLSNLSHQQIYARRTYGKGYRFLERNVHSDRRRDGRKAKRHCRDFQWLDGDHRRNCGGRGQFCDDTVAAPEFARGDRMILDSLFAVLEKNSLITAFAFVGILVWISYEISSAAHARAPARLGHCDRAGTRTCLCWRPRYRWKPGYSPISACWPGRRSWVARCFVISRLLRRHSARNLRH